jgi:hypothetical protein
MDDPSGKVEAVWAHCSGAAPWWRCFGWVWWCLMTVEARDRRWHDPMSPADGEGGGEGELCTITKRRRKSMRGGGYHREH